MTKHLLAASGAALLMLSPSIAMAQSSTSGSNTGTVSADATGSSSGSPIDVTCRELTAMDTETVAGVLYYITGYREGERSGGMGSSMSSSAGSGSSMNQDTAAASGSGTTSGSAGTTTQNQDTASAGSNSGSGSGAGTSTEMDTTGSSATAGSSDMSGGAHQIAALRGYFTIPVEQTIVACGAEPESRASDVIDRQRQSGMSNPNLTGGGASDSGASTAQ